MIPRLSYFINLSLILTMAFVFVSADAQVLRRREAPPATVLEERSTSPHHEHHQKPPKFDKLGKRDEYDSSLFLSDPVYPDKPYDAKAEIETYGGKKAFPTVRPWLELGPPLYDEGPMGAGYNLIGRKNLVRPQFIVVGDLRTAVAYNDNGAAEIGQIATRLNLALDLKLTATERIHAAIQPFNNGARFSRNEFFGSDEDGSELILDGNVDVIFFEGDLSYIQAGITDVYPKYDLPFAFGLMPLFLQNGIWVQDAFVGLAAAIPSRNSPALDISNFDISAFVGFNEVETPAIVKSNGELDEHAADIYGITFFGDLREGHLEASYGYLDDTRSVDAGFDYHSVVAGWTRRYAGKLSNSIRILGNFGQDPDNDAPQTADGFVVLLENSLISSKPSTVVPYANFFAGFDRPLPFARGGTGVLNNTGINFETDGLTGFPKLTDTAQDSWGGAVGIQYLFDLSQQLVFELATVQPYGGASDTIVGDETAFSVRFQKNLSPEWIFRTDAMFADRQNNENILGVRLEFRLKF